MDFCEIASLRQSCRSFDNSRAIDKATLDKIMEIARLAPSACNSQPYFFTVCRGEKKNEVARATMGVGINRFAPDVDTMIVVSEVPYNATAALGAKRKKNDYRSIDIGIVTAYITCAATELGVDSCILGWFDEEKIRSICELDGTVRLVIALGYAKADDKHREKKRKPPCELSKEI